MPDESSAPPRVPRAALRAALPQDSVREAILGDLHEEFVHDAAALGAPHARLRYWRRAGGIVAHVALDALLHRYWGSDAHEAEPPRPASAPAASGAAPSRGARAGAGLGVGVVAFGLVIAGVVGNTMMYTARASTPAGDGVAHSAMGIGAIALAVLTAGGAAVVLCAGPRWLKRRLHRGTPPCEQPQSRGALP